MEKIKEENKKLIASKNNYYTIILSISAGLVWLILSDVGMIKFIFLFILGIYFDCLYIMRLQSADERLNENIRSLH